MSEFDYVIIGAGSAGCVMAFRLSEDPAARVLLIEAGGSDKHPFISIPRGLGKVIGNLRFIWPYSTEAEQACNDTGEYWARGRTLGGSSSINGMMYVRGQDADYDALAAVTSQAWSWQKMAAVYRAIEYHELGANGARGGSGPLRISLPTEKNPLNEAAIEAGAALGLERLEDVNAPADIERIGYAPRTIHRGRRQSAATAFLYPVRHRPNLTIVTEVTIDKVEFDALRAIGVSGTRRGSPVRYNATREIILCAGALATPAVLQRSGIGPADHLSALGIEVVRDNPDVGRNLCEHRGMVMQWRVRDELSENKDLQGAGLAKSIARYFLTGKGALSNAAYEVGAWFRVLPGANRPDGQILFAPYTFDMNSPKLQVEQRGGMNICVYPLRPESRGEVMIRSTTHTELPRITPNFASTEADRHSILALIRYARKFVQQSPLAEMVIEETRPGPHYQTDEELVEAHRKYGYANYHACGTARMGSDPLSVVDPELRVRGVEGLRVADTSIFPFMLAGNTNAPAMALAWRGADLILGKG